MPFALRALDDNRLGQLKTPECFGEIGLAPQTELPSRWTEVGGLRLHSRGLSRVDSTPFVLTHGLVISSLYLIPLAECLAREHAVHALDLPGFGRSPGPRPALDVVTLAESVVAWLSAAGIERCHLVANSLGCQIAAHVAAKAPHLVQSLILIGATVDPAASRLSTQFIRLLRDAVHEPARLWMDWFFDFARAGLRRSIQTIRHMMADRIEAQLPHIHAATLVLRGENDRTMPERWGKEAAALIPNARLETVSQHAHCVHYTAPRLVAEIILEHARRSRAQAPS
ncbi:MAG: alpha/beta fold hydrolase [Chthoniobacteraceae bacterium]